jgi:hypothetical protein
MKLNKRSDFPLPVDDMTRYRFIFGSLSVRYRFIFGSLSVHFRSVPSVSVLDVVSGGGDAGEWLFGGLLGCDFKSEVD